MPSAYEKIQNTRLKVPPSTLNLVVLGSEESDSVSIAASIFGFEKSELKFDQNKINVFS